MHVPRDKLESVYNLFIFSINKQYSPRFKINLEISIFMTWSNGFHKGHTEFPYRHSNTTN